MEKRDPNLIFAVETTFGCNLSCPECAVGSGLANRPKGVMSGEVYDIVAKAIEAHCAYAYLHVWGEPLLNPDIFRIIARTAKFSKSNISTNANTIDADCAEKLIGSGVTDVIVSIDGVSQGVYERYRRGGDARKAMEGLALLASENRRTGGTVKIIPQFLVFEHNQHEMEAFGRICRDLGLEAYFKPPYLREGSLLKPSDIPKYVRGNGSDGEKRTARMRACQNARNVFTILRKGQAVCCCYDNDGQEVFGDITRQGVRDIWNSPEYERFRADVRNGNFPEFCKRNCLL